MKFSPVVERLVRESGINKNVCEGCGAISNNNVVEGESRTVRIIYKYPGGIADKRNAVSSINDFLFVCPDCRFKMAGHREEWFKRLRRSKYDLEIEKWMKENPPRIDPGETQRMVVK